ncbi:MAG: methyltransferase domain-containing protein [Pseudomonadota bacterium]
MEKATQEAARKVSLKVRLKAWWEGYDAAELDAYLHGEGAPPEPKNKAAKPAPPPRGAIEQLVEDKAAEADKREDKLPFDPWDKARIDVAQFIWGEGYCGPGGPDHVIAISKLLALSPELSMADIGAGLGGPARTLAEHFGVWMTGYEMSQALVDAGNQLSTMAGMAKKAPLAHFSPDGAFEFERRYDRMIAKESLSTIEAKTALLPKMEAALKADGLLLIIDYVLANESVVGSQAYRAWRDGEPRKLFMVTQEEMSDLIAKAGLAIRVNEDRTKDQIELITHAWQGVDKLIARLMANPAEKHLVKVLLKEAELWSRRVQMMQDGHLKLCRFLAAKKERKRSMMSDW